MLTIPSLLRVCKHGFESNRVWRSAGSVVASLAALKSESPHTHLQTIVFERRVVSVYSLCIVVASFLSNDSHAQTESVRPVVSQSVQYPHSSGYQLGDQFEHILKIEMRRPYKLVNDSLPSTGRLSGYIDLQKITVNQTNRLRTTAYNISLLYQVINYDDGLVGTSVPPALVSFSTDSDVYPVVIEPWGFTISPFLMKEARNNGAMPELQALTEPTSIPLRGRAITCVLLLLGGIALLWPGIRQSLISPIIQWRNRPFNKAHRSVLKMTRTVSLSSLEQSLKRLHEAFNNTLGCTMLSEDVDSFLNSYPGFTRSRKEIVRFFSLSDRHFFGDNDLNDEEIFQYTSFIKSLSSTLRSDERRAWRRAY